MIVLATILSGLSLLMSFLLITRLKVTLLGLVLWSFKLAAGALSPFWAILGAVGALLGWVSGALWAIPIGILGAGMMIWYIRGVSRDHNGFENAFCATWSDQIKPERASQMAKRRWTLFLKTSREYSLIRDVPFWTIPGTDRELLCDIWRPWITTLPAWHSSTITAAAGILVIKILAQDHSLATWLHRDIP